MDYQYSENKPDAAKRLHSSTGRAAPRDLADLKARVDLAEIAGRHTKLVKRDRALWGCCPLHGERTPSFKVEGDRFHCFGCGAHGDVIDFVVALENVTTTELIRRVRELAGGTLGNHPPAKPRPSPPEIEDNTEHAQQIWREASPLCDCQLGAVYLKSSRGIWWWPETVYFHPACPFGDAWPTAPAILAPVNDPVTGLVRAIWRIKLDHQGNKLWRGGYGTCPGGASRLFDHWDGHIGIAEGIEDTLALHLKTGLPCWAALSTNGMRKMVLPDRVRRVTICQDNDGPNDMGHRPGPEAAQALACRLRAEGREVRIIASSFGKDANDALLRRQVS